MSIWELAVRWVIFGGLAILAFAVIEAMWEQRATKRRNAFRDARRSHPAALAHTSGHCPPCAEKGGCGCRECAWRAEQRNRFPDPTRDQTGDAS
jgi:hypothetical protein